MSNESGLPNHSTGNQPAEIRVAAPGRPASSGDGTVPGATVGLPRHWHWLHLLATAVLLGYGILFIYSARFVEGGVHGQALHLRQVQWLEAGALVFLLVAAGDYRWLVRLSWALYGGAVFFLVLVLFLGETLGGATRWLSLFGFVFQPAEVAKLALVFHLAVLLGEPDRARYGRWLLPLVATVVVVPVALILAEPALGTALIAFGVAWAMAFVAGLFASRLGWVLVALTVLVAVQPLAIGLTRGIEPVNRFYAQVVSHLPLQEYQKRRLRALIAPDRDPRGNGWQAEQALSATASGGLLGKGYLRGSQNKLNYLPRTVAPTDFVFAVIAEETGLAGVALLLTAYGSVAFFCLRTAISAPDRTGTLLCAGIGCLIAGHVFVHVGMTVGLLPVTGLPLPLVSYGGTFLLVVLAGLGLVESVYRQALQEVGAKPAAGV